MPRGSVGQRRSLRAAPAATRQPGPQPHGTEHLIWRAWLSSGRWACRPLGGRGGVMWPVGRCGLRRRAVSLICAGWLPHDRGASGAVGWSRDRASPAVWCGLAAHRCVAGGSSRGWRAAPPASSDARSGLQDGQAPAPAGKLAGDRDHADGGALGASVQPTPALLQPAVATVGACSARRRLAGVTGPELAAGPIRFAVMPGHARPAAVGHGCCRSWRSSPGRGGRRWTARWAPSPARRRGWPR